MARKTGLGRGLDALIGQDRPAFGEVNLVAVDQIIPNPRQPRARLNPAELEELAASIKAHGVLQPLIVTYDENTQQYTLIAGSRRLRAAEMAGLAVVPAIVRQADEQQRLELALIENLQRTDLSPLEAAEAYRQLVDDFSLSHEEVAARVGKSRVAVTNTLRLLKLPDVVKQALAERRISEGHARALLSLPTAEAQTAALRVILQQELSVRQTEKLVNKLLGERPQPKTAPPVPAEIADLEERLRARLGTKVHLARRGKGGSLVIYFYSDEELNALIEKILGETL